MPLAHSRPRARASASSATTPTATTTMSALKRLAVGQHDRFRALAALDRGDAEPEAEARAEGGVALSGKNPT